MNVKAPITTASMSTLAIWMLLNIILFMHSFGNDPNFCKSTFWSTIQDFTGFNAIWLNKLNDPVFDWLSHHKEYTTSFEPLVIFLVYWIITGCILGVFVDNIIKGICHLTCNDSTPPSPTQSK